MVKMITLKIFLFTRALLCSVKQCSSVTEEESHVSIPCQEEYFVNLRSTGVMTDKLMLILVNQLLSNQLIEATDESGGYQRWNKWIENGRELYKGGFF